VCYLRVVRGFSPSTGLGNHLPGRPTIAEAAGRHHHLQRFRIIQIPAQLGVAVFSGRVLDLGGSGPCSGRRFGAVALGSSGRGGGTAVRGALRLLYSRGTKPRDAGWARTVPSPKIPEGPPLELVGDCSGARAPDGLAPTATALFAGRGFRVGVFGPPRHRKNWPGGAGARRAARPHRWGRFIQFCGRCARGRKSGNRNH
jgi:hypothetical protein